MTSCEYQAAPAMPHKTLSRIGVGPLVATDGQAFETLASDDWRVGEEITTWAGHRVLVTRKTANAAVGLWKYTYCLQVLSAANRRNK